MHLQCWKINQGSFIDACHFNAAIALSIPLTWQAMISASGIRTRIVPNRLEAGNETELKLLRMRRGILFRTAAPYNGKHVKKRSFGFSSYRWSIESPPTEVAGLSWILIPVTVLYPYTLSDQGNIEFWQTSE